MSYNRGADRSQVQLLPACVEDYVPTNSPARFIDAFVEGLDLQKLGFTRAQPAQTGRPPYHPADLLKLYIYGYLYRIRSSRRLEAEAARNLEVIWLLRCIRPDFKTIADFRAENRDAFKPLFKQFNLLCRKLELFGAELVAIDGSKFKAVNNPRHHYSQKSLQELIRKIEARIDNYLQDIEASDSEAAGGPSAPSRQELEEKIARLKQARAEYEATLGAMKERSVSEISTVDPNSRAMKKVGIGYNVQVAVDSKNHLIVEPEVVQSASDRGQLSNMATAAKTALEAAELKVAADAGYHEATQLESCEKNGIQTYVPETGKTSGMSTDGKQVFPKERFSYDAASDTYRCPGRQILSRGSVGKSRGKDRALYYNRAACRACSLKEQCTAGRFRLIPRRLNEDVVERQAERLKAHPEMMKQRRAIVEHVFGTLRMWGHDDFLLRGLQKVRAEFSLSALTYNLRRILNVVDFEELMRSAV
jgi:transposase